MKKAGFAFMALVVALCIIMLSVERMRIGKVKHSRVTENWITSPVHIVEGSNIDASFGSEFAITLTGNTTLGIVNVRDYHSVGLVVTNSDFSLTFTNQIEWMPRGIAPRADTNAITQFFFVCVDGRLYGNKSSQMTSR